jgi:hypothetical protein
VFYYSRDRAGEHPQTHLANYSGIFQADAYGGYPSSATVQTISNTSADGGHAPAAGKTTHICGFAIRAKVVAYRFV